MADFQEVIRRDNACLGRGLQGRGRGFDMGSITVHDRTLQRQKEPSVTLVFCKLRPSFSLSRQPLGPLGKSGLRQGTPWKGCWLERLPVTREASGSSPVAPANTIHEKTGSKVSP